jgi:geranylgeranyl diphosphate synthase type I
VKLAPAGPEDPPASAEFLSQVEQELLRCLDRHRARVAAAAPEAGELLDELQRVIEAGGKRIRPLFCLWGHRSGGGQVGWPIARAAAAMEMLHTSALIHDDVLDRSHLRRGIPSSFRRLGTLAPRHAERFGAAAALLAGDLGQALADDLLATSPFPPERIAAAFGHFDQARADAATGEFLDLLAVARGSAADGDEPRIRGIATRKSGSYSVVGPLLVGATLAGADRGVAAMLAAYGEPLGEAFQLRDDILGTYGDPAVTGKDPDDDLREGKRTLLVARAVAMATPADRRLLGELIGRPDLVPAQAEAARAAIERSGAVASVTGLIDELAAQAVGALRDAPVPDDVRAALEGLAERVALRVG